MEDRHLSVGEKVEVELTYEDYAAMPDDGRRYQLIEGEIEVTPAPSSPHQRVSRNIELILGQHVKKRKLGATYYAPFDAILSKNTVVQPDILFVSRERLKLVSERGIEGGPDLIVEILSPKTRRVDRVSKMRVYAKAGVREYWLVDPRIKTAEVFSLEKGKWTLVAALTEEETLRSPLLPDLEIPLAEIFAED